MFRAFFIAAIVTAASRAWQEEFSGAAGDNA
jgi:hypothetical protein